MDFQTVPIGLGIGMIQTNQARANVAPRRTDYEIYMGLLFCPKVGGVAKTSEITCHPS
jgi:hypothetical protein